MDWKTFVKMKSPDQESTGDYITHRLRAERHGKREMSHAGVNREKITAHCCSVALPPTTTSWQSHSWPTAESSAPNQDCTLLYIEGWCKGHLNYGSLQSAEITFNCRHLRRGWPSIRFCIIMQRVFSLCHTAKTVMAISCCGSWASFNLSAFENTQLSCKLTANRICIFFQCEKVWLRSHQPHLLYEGQVTTSPCLTRPCFISLHMAMLSRICNHLFHMTF